MPDTKTIAGYLDGYLKTGTVADWPDAHNGLQIENSGKVTKIGAAVDACEFTFQEAVGRGIDFLLVHHGLFWGGAKPLTGGQFRKFKTAFDQDLAVYSSHLPLDLHPVEGNNALLCKALGFKKKTPFFFEKGQFIGFQASHSMDRDDLVAQLEDILGSPVKLCPGGPKRTAQIGVVTGGAGGEIRLAAREGVDTFITGEGPHHTYLLAEELGVNLIYGGHYATETLGVKAMAAHLSRRFKLPWEFIDHPTGL